MPESLYLKIREERIKQGISQKELGEMVGLPQQAINRIEQGQRKLDIELFEKLCRALKIRKIGAFSVDFISSYYKTDVDDEPIDFSEESQTIAAHFDGDEYTEEELQKIREYAEFIKSQRKNLQSPPMKKVTVNEVNARLKPVGSNTFKLVKEQQPGNSFGIITNESVTSQKVAHIKGFTGLPEVNAAHTDNYADVPENLKATGEKIMDDKDF